MRSRFFLFLAVAGALAPAVAGQTADADFAAFQALARRQPPKPAAELSPRESIEFTESLGQERRTAALAFLAAHPADPRRWNIVNALNPSSPRFIKEIGAPGENGVPRLTIDEAAAAAWKARVAELKEAMARASDLPEDLVEQRAWSEFARDFRAVTVAKNAGKPHDYTPFEARFAAHVARFGKLPSMPVRRPTISVRWRKTSRAPV